MLPECSPSLFGRRGLDLSRGRINDPLRAGWRSGNAVESHAGQFTETLRHPALLLNEDLKLLGQKRVRGAAYIFCGRILSVRGNVRWRGRGCGRRRGSLRRGCISRSRRVLRFTASRETHRDDCDQAGQEFFHGMANHRPFVTGACFRRSHRIATALFLCVRR